MEKYTADRTGSGQEKPVSLLFSLIFQQDPRFSGQGKVSSGQLLEIRADGAAAGNHHNVPAGPEQGFVEPINFPQAAADPIADHSMTQLFADGDAYPIGTSPIFPGVENHQAVGVARGGVKPPEDVIQFQAAGKFHGISSGGMPFRNRSSKTSQKTCSQVISKNMSKRKHSRKSDCQLHSERFCLRSRMKIEGILRVFRDFHNDDMRQKIRCTVAR